MAHSVAKIRESISLICDLPVLATNLLHSLQVVQSASWPECRDTTVNRVVLVAGAARVGIDCLLHEICNVVHEV